MSAGTGEHAAKKNSVEKYLFCFVKLGKGHVIGRVKVCFTKQRRSKLE